MIIKHPALYGKIVLTIFLGIIIASSVRAQFKPGISANGKTFSKSAKIDTLEICLGSTVLFKSVASGAGITNWRFDNGTPNMYNNNNGPFNIFYSTESTGRATQTIISPDGQQKDSMYIIIKVSAPEPNLKATFTYTPSTLECASSLFTFTPDYKTSKFSYNWYFGDGGYATTQTATHQYFSPTGTGTQNLSVTLKVADAIGCRDSATKSLTVKKVPDASVNNTDNNVLETTFNGLKTFSYCDPAYKAGSFYKFKFANSSTTQSTNKSYHIIWGDGVSADSVFSNWNLGEVIEHDFPFGSSLMTIEVTGPQPDACLGRQQYYVFVGSKQQIGVQVPATEICEGETGQFEITNYLDDPPGTIYKYVVSGLIDSTIVNPNVNNIVTIQFDKTSCGQPGNVWNVEFFAINACGSSKLATDVAVSQKPKSALTVSPNQQTFCVNDVATVVNSTYYGNVVTGDASSGYLCTYGSGAKQAWTISPATGYTVTGNLGVFNGTNIISSGSPQLQIKFTAPGIYTIKLYASNERCGFDSSEKKICVRFPPSALFAYSGLSNCSNDTLLLTNTTTVEGCDGNSYKWQITNLDPAKCASGIAPQFVNSSTDTSITPRVWLKEAGHYQVKLTATAINTDGSCFDTFYDTVLLKGKPKIDLNTLPAAICVNSSINPAVQTDTCYGTTPFIYAWSFPNGVPASSSNQIPGSVLYSQTGLQKIKVRVNDASCGAVLDSTTIDVIAKPVAQAGPLKEICSGKSVTIGSAAVNGYSYKWSPGTGLSSTNDAQPTVTLINNSSTNDTVRYSLTVTVGSASDCFATDFVDVVVKQSPQVTVNPPAASLCSGGSVILNASGATTYSWSPGGTLSGTTGTTVTATPSTTTTYSITGSLANGCSETKDILVTISSKPFADAGTLQTTCGGKAVTIGTSAMPGYNYIWTPAAGLSSTTIAQPLVIVNNNNADNSNDTLRYYLTVSTGGTKVCSSEDSVEVIIKKSPSLTLNKTNAAVCDGDSIVLKAEGAQTYVWSPSTYLNTSTGNEVIVMPAASISYTLTGSLSNGCTSDTTIAVTLNPNAKADFDTTGANFCAPYNLADVVNITAYPDRNDTYSWYDGTKLIDVNSTGKAPNYEVQNEGDSILLKLVTTSKFGCQADSISAKFTSNPATRAAFKTSINQGCEPLIVYFNNNTNNLNSAVYNWNFGDGQTSNAPQPDSIIFTTGPQNRDTTYYITLISDNNCITSTVQDSVRVLAKPSARLGIDSVLLCSGQQIEITNASLGSNLDFTWNFGDGSFYSTSFNIPVYHTYISNIVDTFTVRLYAQNYCGIDSNSLNLRVAPNSINAQLSVSASELFGCAPHIVTFNNSTIGASKYTWNFGDNSDTTIFINSPATLAHIYTQPGIYTVSLFLSNGGCTDTTIYKTITVYQKPVASFTIQTIPNDVFCFGDTIYTSNTSLYADAYRWHFDDNSPVEGIVSPYHYYQNTGAYTMQLIADKFNDFGIVCSDTLNKPIKVGTKPIVNVTSSMDIDCFENTTVLTATGGVAYSWTPPADIDNPGRGTTTAHPDTTVVYHIAITGASGCVVEDSVKVFVDYNSAPNQFQMPSAFTPNGDGNNDIFKLKYIGNIKSYKLSVFNREGKLIFTTSDPSTGWDGTYNGRKMPPAAYVYFITLYSKCSTSGEEKRFLRKGTIVLIR